MAMVSAASCQSARQASLSLLSSTVKGANPRSIGEITAAELGSVMKSLGLKPSDIELQDIMNEIDVDQSGTISFDGRCSISRIQKSSVVREYRSIDC